MSKQVERKSLSEIFDDVFAKPVQFWACPICDGSRVKWDEDIATCLNCKRTNNTVSPDSEAASVTTSTITKWYRLPKVPEIGIPVIVAGIFKEESDRIKAWYMGDGKWKSQASKEEIQDWMFQVYAWAYERLPVAPPATPSRAPSGIHKKEVFIDGALLECGYFGSESNGGIKLNCEHWLDKLPSEHSVSMVITYNIQSPEASNSAKAEAYQPPDSATVVLVTDSEGANEGTITISPGDGDTDLDLTTIRSQNSGGAEAVTITAPGEDGVKTTETLKLDGVNPVSTKKRFSFGDWGDDSEETK